jgi:hypothetical protein
VPDRNRNKAAPRNNGGKTSRGGREIIARCARVDPPVSSNCSLANDRNRESR